MWRRWIGWYSLTRWMCCKRLITFVVIMLFFSYLRRLEIPSDSSFSHETRYPRVVIGILTDWQQMEALVQASKHTWIKQLSYDIFYFVGRSNLVNTTLAKEPNVVVLPYNDDEYPPLNKTFAMWYYFYANDVMNYDFFVAADSDTYINVKHLETMINQLTCRDCYVGYSSSGGKLRSRLGLHAPYCQGMGYVISRSTLLQFGPHINICRTSIVARHSDTEIARCIHKYVHNLSCSGANIPFEMVSYTSNEKNEKVPLRLNARRQMQVDFPQAPPTRFFRAVMVHPVKQPHSFYNFHRQVVLYLRPILSPVFATGSCVANPVLQQETHPQSQYIPECPPSRTNKFLDVKSLNVFVLTLPDREQRVSHLINAFHEHAIRVERFNAVASFIRPVSTKLTTEQWRLRLIMTHFFHTALAANLQRVLVLEEDAIPHRHFGSRLEELLSDSRCGEYMLDTHGGGIIMLGATVWKDGWHVLDKLSINETGSCRNICSKTYGSFAVLYHKTTFKTILTWLNTTTNDPYDHVFAYLSRLGYPVRLASPNLVIKDVTHRSLIGQPHNDTVYYDLEKRASIHRWNLTDYMFTQYVYS